MKQLLLILSTLLSTVVYSQSSIYGGNFEVTQIGSNQFIMSAMVQIDTLNVTSMTINTFDNTTDTFVKSFTINFDSSAIIPLRYKGASFDSIYVNYLSDTFNLNNNSNGYYFVNNEFSRISGIANFRPGNYIFSCQIPDPSIIGGNSNPKFVNFYDSLYFKFGEDVLLNFSCIDSDNDSLFYSFVTPHSSTSSIGGKPFTLLSWHPVYNLANLLGSASLCLIRNNTGMVTAGPPQVRKYTISVKCEEFRNGVKIGEVTRDISICNNIFYSSIKEKSIINITSVFPNPSNGNFTLSLENENFKSADMKIYDVYGKLVHSQQINSAKSSINLEEFNTGIYFIQLNDGVNQVTQRIVIH